MKAILETLNLGQKKSITDFRYSKKNFETPWHFHPQNELTFIEQSTGTKFIGDYVGSYQPGELVLLRSNLPHCWKNRVEGKERSESIVIHWNSGIFSTVPELAVLFEMMNNASRGIIFSREETELFVPILRSMPTLSDTRLYVALLSLLCELSNCKYKTLSEKSFTDDLSNGHSSRISMVHNFVSEHFGRKIYLKELAQLVNMSEQSFSRFFSKMMGRPFFSFLNEYRINIAARMLIETDKSVAEIGFFCGYDSLPFFHKQFNKFKRKSPAKYRKHFKTKSS